ncbi:hypothetical protein DFH09DRAFT_1084378 [Mycena vulgaris]|nr:hypothetical protein DFH09DRAFT_1084378 [Mycena vulgaris]
MTPRWLQLFLSSFRLVTARFLNIQQPASRNADANTIRNSQLGTKSGFVRLCPPRQWPCRDADVAMLAQLESLLCIGTTGTTDSEALEESFSSRKMPDSGENALLLRSERPDRCTNSAGVGTESQQAVPSSKSTDGQNLCRPAAKSKLSPRSSIIWISHAQMNINNTEKGPAIIPCLSAFDPAALCSLRSTGGLGFPLSSSDHLHHGVLQGHGTLPVLVFPLPWQLSAAYTHWYNASALGSDSIDDSFGDGLTMPSLVDLSINYLGIEVERLEIPGLVAFQQRSGFQLRNLGLANAHAPTSELNSFLTAFPTIEDLSIRWYFARALGPPETLPHLPMLRALTIDANEDGVAMALARSTIRRAPVSQVRLRQNMQAEITAIRAEGTTVDLWDGYGQQRGGNFWPCAAGLARVIHGHQLLVVETAGGTTRERDSLALDEYERTPSGFFPVASVPLIATATVIILASTGGTHGDINGVQNLADIIRRRQARPDSINSTETTQTMELVQAADPAAVAQRSGVEG